MYDLIQYSSVIFRPSWLKMTGRGRLPEIMHLAPQLPEGGRPAFVKIKLIMP